MNTEPVTYEVVWSPATGWRDRSWGRGELIPPHDSNTTLTEAAREAYGRSPNPMIRLKSKYSPALRDAVKARRADGATYQRIAIQFELPLHTAFNLVNEK